MKKKGLSLGLISMLLLLLLTHPFLGLAEIFFSGPWGTLMYIALIWMVLIVWMMRKSRRHA